MSNKINVLVVVKDHLNTLRNYHNGKTSLIDVSFLLLLPLAFVVWLALCGYSINKEFVSLVVNFSSIVTSLLISVLVLIYDQYSKTDDQALKKEVLGQLFSNVSYTILMGVITVIFCLLLNIYPYDMNGNYQISTITYFIQNYEISINLVEILFTPAILFFLLQMILTLFMTLKRLHIIFFAK
ncbi:hypothetical protein ACLSZP_10480 [Avibacterium avium]|uniref:hypothetical protein n=1 Tax=Avibacterium avium TaxID=751 RepID=UPI0039FD35D3